MARDEDDDLLDLLRSRRERKATSRQIRAALFLGGLSLVVFTTVAIAIVMRFQRNREQARTNSVPPPSSGVPVPASGVPSSPAPASDVPSSVPQPFSGQQSSNPPPISETPKASKEAPTQKTADCKFGDWIGSGNLQVRILHANSNAHVQGVVGRDGDRRNLTIVVAEARNTHAGKIVDWPGWQDKGQVEDEFGNLFKPTDGWSVWYPAPPGIPNDFPNRIPPTTGEAIRGVLYFERVPVTSKRITITLPFEGMQVRFLGNHGQR